MKPWIVRANRIVSALSRDAYLKANRKPDGTFRKRHVPYTIPQVAVDLVDCIGRDDEHEAKRLMMWDYDATRAAGALT